MPDKLHDRFVTPPSGLFVYRPGASVPRRRSAGWDPKDHPRGPDGKFGEKPGSNTSPSAAFGRLQRSVDSGIEHSETLSGSGAALSVERVDFNDGSRAIRKTAVNRDESDAEILASHVGAALGVPVPAVIPDEGYRNGRGYTVFMQFVSGQTAFEAGQGIGTPENRAFQESEQGRKAGLLHALVNNYDLHDGNLMVTPGGAMIPIDFGSASIDNTYGYDADGDLLPNNISGPYYRNLVERGSGGDLPSWKDGGGLPKSYFDEVRPKLEQLEETFDEYDRHSWFHKVRGRFEAIAKTAK